MELSLTSSWVSQMGQRVTACADRVLYSPTVSASEPVEVLLSSVSRSRSTLVVYFKAQCYRQRTTLCGLFQIHKQICKQSMIATPQTLKPWFAAVGTSLRKRVKLTDGSGYSSSATQTFTFDSFYIAQTDHQSLFGCHLSSKVMP
jgi:hypothetical protein